MTQYLMRIVMPNGSHGPWLVDFEHEAMRGRGNGTFSYYVDEAKRFASHDEAMEFWRKQSVVQPLRDDGEPNRPLSGFSISIEPLP